MAAEGTTLLRRNDELPGEAGSISDIIVLVVLGQTQHILRQELCLRREEKVAQQSTEGGDPGDLETALFSQHIQGESLSLMYITQLSSRPALVLSSTFRLSVLTYALNCHNYLGPANEVALSSLLVPDSILLISSP